MKEHGWIEPIVERVVGQVLDSHAAQLRTEIVQRVMREIAANPAAAQPTNDNGISASGPADLARAVAEIQLGSSQKEILRALLDTTARYAARVALFVVKGSHATGWQARGFANSDGVKDFQLDEKARAVSRAISERVMASSPAADLDSRFLRDFGAPSSGEGRILPLILKDKVAALVYADAGTNDAGSLDAGSLELLVLSTSAWLEVNSLRKQNQAHAESPGVPAAEAVTSHTPVQTVSAFNDPFASHAPGHAMAAAASVSAHEASAPVASAAAAAPIPTPTMAEPLPIGDAQAEGAPEGLASSHSPEDQDVHRKAQRFARLLVDEVKLYNQAKVAEGRKNKDLYDRLKEAIEKSRATYQKRYGNTVAASANYFQNEIIRSLAEDDLSIMGANFRH
ncbi:MAG TPA: hypothetical protein VIX14_01915 [Terriglobales bacterium]